MSGVADEGVGAPGAILELEVLEALGRLATLEGRVSQTYNRQRIPSPSRSGAPGLVWIEPYQ